MKKILISDLRVSRYGHNLGWLQNIYGFLQKYPDNNQYFFLFNPEAKNSFIIPKDNSQFSTEFVDDKLFSLFETEKRPIKRYNLQWKFIKSHAEKLEVDKVILMELDMYQIALGFETTKFKISGIWFQPYYRMQTLSSSMKDKTQLFLRKIRKKVTIKWAIRNNNFDKIFILNDFKAVDNANESLKPVFRYLPDPAFDYPFKEGLVIRKKHGIADEKVVFLIFGAIDDRKNVVNILKAFQQLTPELASNSALLIIGKVAGFYQNTFNSEIENTLKLQPNLQIITESRFVDDEEMESFFSQSDVILRMNVNFFASSGVVGNAAKFNKPLIVSDYGLVAEQIIEHKLGKLADPDDIEQIKKAIIDYIENPQERVVDGSVFYRTHDRDFTIRTLLS